MQHRTLQAASSRKLHRRSQSGVVMIIALLALVILLISSVALIRSFDTSMLLAGNLAIKRDLLNQGERGVDQAVTLLSTGSLASEALRDADQAGQNYFATKLPSNSQGVPTALLGEEEYAKLGKQHLPDIDAGNGVRIRVIIDRQCRALGEFTPENCMAPIAAADPGGSDFLKKPSGDSRPAYRISVRVQDTQRKTETYLQAIATI